MTLGIFGAWGSGKTSLMAVLKYRLDQDAKANKIRTIWFNAWKYEGRDEAQSALIHAILAKLTEGRTLADDAKEVLRRLAITQPNQVWCSDITYIRMQHGFMYLVAVMDWYSRYVLAWKLSNTLDTHFCIKALERALAQAKPNIVNTDQGAQFTADAFTSCLEASGIEVSMDGRGRAFDNIFIERLWRSVKYEDIYLHEYASVPALEQGLDAYFRFYNEERPHQSLSLGGLDYRTPAEIHFAGKGV